MEGLGTIIGLIFWGLYAAANAAKRSADKKNQAAGAAPPVQPGPTATPDQHLARSRSTAVRQASAVVESLEQTRALVQQADHAELGALVRATSEAAQRRAAELRAAFEGEPTPAQTVLLTKITKLRHLSALLRRLVDSRVDAESGEQMRRLAAAVEEAVPDLKRRVLVFRGGEHERGNTLIADSSLLLLVLTENPKNEPWVVAGLIEDAWASALLEDETQAAAVRKRAVQIAVVDDAMERFASGLAQVWAPALQVDAACTLSLAGGHAARVRALAEEEPTNELFVLRMDEQQRVDSVPPVGLRLLLLRRLLEATGGPTSPPLPPNPVLHLRGPGVWDQVPLLPVLDRAAELQALFAEDLSRLDGLQDPAGIERQAREWLEQSASGAAPRRPDARVLFAALGLCAALPEGSQAGRSLLETLKVPVSTAAQRRSARRRAQPSRSRGSRPGRISRARVLGDAILLGEALSGPRP